MISWIQRSFQQHFKWLFLLLLAVVIVSFVFITNASSGFGHTGKQAAARPFFGVNLSAREDIDRIFNDASLSAQLHGMPIRDQGQLQQYALQRQAALHLADELRLPAPAEAELVRHVQSLRAFSGPEGRFDPKRYAEFRDSLKTNPQLREADVTRVINDDVTYQQVLKLLSGPGYVLPADVQTQLNRIDATWTLEAVTIDYDSFKPSLNVTDEALSQYFEYNSRRYEIAPKVAVSYIDFPAEAFTAQVSVSEVGLRSYYEANPARFPKPAAATPEISSNPGADFDAVREQVEQAFRLERARTLALRAASDVAVALHDGPITAEKLPDFLAKQQLALQPLAPFNADNVPAQLGTDRRVASEALRTGPQKPYSEPINTGRGAAILVWNETIAARVPELAEIKDRITADYLEAEKRKQFAQAGRTLRTALAARLKAGDSFAKAVEASGKAIPAKLATKSWPAFTLATPPQDFDYSAYGAIDGLNKGELSQMVSSGEKGLILYAADKKLPDLDPASSKFAETRERMQTFTASRNGGAVLAAMVDAELAKTAAATP